MRFRFTIRDLLWLTVVAALAVAWGMTLDENRRLRKPHGFAGVFGRHQERFLTIQFHCIPRFPVRSALIISPRFGSNILKTHYPLMDQ